MSAVNCAFGKHMPKGKKLMSVDINNYKGSALVCINFVKNGEFKTVKRKLWLNPETYPGAIKAEGTEWLEE